MEIKDFFKGMLPFFPRSRLQEDIKNSLAEYSTMVMPSLQLAEKEYKGSYKSEGAKALGALYARFGGKNAGNIFGDLKTRFAKLGDVYQAIESQLMSEFGETVVTAGLSARTANMIRMINLLGFLNDFALRVTNAIMHFECQAAGSGMNFISDVTPGEVQYLEKHMIDFSQALDTLSSIKNPAEALKAIPDVLIENAAVARSFGLGKVDPFNLFGSSMGFRGSPFYWLGMQIAEIQHDRYKKMESRKKALEKRLLAHRRAMSGSPSPQAEEELEILTSRIAAVDDKMRKYERSVERSVQQ